MPQTTPSGVVYYTPADAPNLATITQGMAQSIDTKITPAFASTAARATAITNPVDGQETYQLDTKRYERWSASTSAWTYMLTTRVQVTRNSSQAFASGAIGTIGWTGTTYDPNGLTAGAGGVTVSAAGYYEVAFSGEFAANATGRRFACIMRNGSETTEVNRFTVPANTAANGTGLVLPGVGVICAAGDVLTVGVYQDSGVGLNLNASATMRVSLAA